MIVSVGLCCQCGTGRMMFQLGCVDCVTGGLLYQLGCVDIVVLGG